jgi:hypothetical protein
MARVVVELDMVEQQVLDRLLELGLFETPQEALRIALLKYAIDLGSLTDIPEEAHDRLAEKRPPAPLHTNGGSRKSLEQDRHGVDEG